MFSVYLIYEWTRNGGTQLLGAYSTLEMAEDTVKKYAAARGREFVLIDDESIGKVVYGVEEGDHSIGEHLYVAELDVVDVATRPYSPRPAGWS